MKAHLSNIQPHLGIASVIQLQMVGVFAHPHRPHTLPLATRVAASLQAQGIQTWVENGHENADVPQKIADSNLIVAIGGDGAILRTARLCAPANVPILGLNVGYLGFLTEILPDAWETTLPRLLAGDYWIEERMMLRSETWRNDRCVTMEEALNDIVVERGAVARSVRLEAYIDGAWLTTYNADGLIISTATGSTAYALAAGGPILPPDLHNIMVIPVAPHLSMDRPLVLSQGATIKVIVAQDNHTEVIVTADGRHIEKLGANDYVKVMASEKVSRFVRLRERDYFFRSILDRLEPRLVKRRSVTVSEEENP